MYLSLSCQEDLDSILMNNQIWISEKFFMPKISKRLESTEPWGKPLLIRSKSELNDLKP